MRWRKYLQQARAASSAEDLDRKKEQLEGGFKSAMGVFRYPIVLYSPDGSRGLRVEALVDTGATYTWVPRPILEELGHRPGFRQRLRLASGEVIERDGCEVVVAIDGARRTTPVIFGDPGSEVLLGAVTLEQFSLAPDPVARKLVPVEALLM